VPYDNLAIERSDHIATITLNRPEALNALDRGLTRDMHMALDELAGEFPDIRVVILTGAGRGFCSGADVMAQAQALSPKDEPQPFDPLNSIPPLAPKLQAIPQPVIAAVNGVAAGAGFSLAMASDIRLAAESSRYAVIFVKRSLVPDTGSSHSLPAVVGRGTAMEMALTGRVYDAAWALERGLVNYVVPDDQLLAEARTLALEIAGNPPLCVRSIKQLMHRTDRLAEVLPYEHDANTPSMNTKDRREAVMSFVEKRDAVFEGR
jgi:enoyl-CoA hydratase/carnithine racemase